MPNTNPQSVYVANNKIRPLADRFGQLFNECKAKQAEAQAEGWAAMFPADAEVIVDGSATDGRTQITNTDVNTFINTVSAFITFMEQNSNANRNNVLKIAVNPER